MILASLHQPHPTVTLRTTAAVCGGMQITAADELYHTKWANATGTHSLQLPFAARCASTSSPPTCTRTAPAARC